MMEARTVVWPILLRLWNETEGQDLIEYSLLLGFIAISLLAVLSGIRSNFTAILSRAGYVISSATTAS